MHILPRKSSGDRTVAGLKQNLRQNRHGPEPNSRRTEQLLGSATKTLTEFNQKVCFKCFKVAFFKKMMPQIKMGRRQMHTEAVSSVQRRMLHPPAVPAKCPPRSGEVRKRRRSLPER